MDVKEVTSALSIHCDDPRVDADADVVPSPPGGLAAVCRSVEAAKQALALDPWPARSPLPQVF